MYDMYNDYTLPILIYICLHVHHITLYLTVLTKVTHISAVSHNLKCTPSVLRGTLEIHLAGSRNYNILCVTIV